MDNTTLRKLFRLVEAFRTLDSEMPVQQCATFLYVALNTDNDVSVQSVSKATGQGSSSTSRNIAALSRIVRPGKPGLDLIETRENPYDRRFKTVHLTEKGRRFAENLGLVEKGASVVDGGEIKPVNGGAPRTVDRPAQAVM